MPPGVAAAGPPTCPPDAVPVGPTCVDTYEASVWQIPADQTALIEKVQAGTVTKDDLTAGMRQPVDCGMLADSFPANGNWTEKLYATSVAGVQPTTCMSWLQAEQACAASGKRLITNQEWQRAAALSTAGTACTQNPTLTTGADACWSNWSANDMGNWFEWVAEWTDLATRIGGACTTWLFPFWGVSCVGGPGGPNVGFGGPRFEGDPSLPGARHRGNWEMGTTSPGVFTISDGDVTTKRGYPSWQNRVAFRCAR